MSCKRGMQELVGSLLLCAVGQGVCAEIGELPISYACARGNTSFTGYLSERKLYGGYSSMPNYFPKSKEGVPNFFDVGAGLIQFVDCSDARFRCASIEQKYTADRPVWTYIIAVPRDLSLRGEYRVREAQLSIRQALPSIADDMPRIQIAIQQKIEGKDVEMRLTVEEKRGIIYWDGFRMNSPSSDNGQLCVLRTDSGLLAQVQ